jgi:hypothetical protein
LLFISLIYHNKYFSDLIHLILIYKQDYFLRIYLFYTKKNVKFFYKQEANQKILKVSFWVYICSRKKPTRKYEWLCLLGPLTMLMKILKVSFSSSSCRRISPHPNENNKSNINIPNFDFVYKNKFLFLNILFIGYRYPTKFWVWKCSPYIFFQHARIMFKKY